jgi:hypothetical protein
VLVHFRVRIVAFIEIPNLIELCLFKAFRAGGMHK